MLLVEQVKSFYWCVFWRKLNFCTFKFYKCFQFILGIFEIMLYVSLVDVVMCLGTRFWMWRSVFSLLCLTVFTSRTCLCSLHLFHFLSSYNIKWKILYILKPVHEGIQEQEVLPHEFYTTALRWQATFRVQPVLSMTESTELIG